MKGCVLYRLYQGFVLGVTGRYRALMDGGGFVAGGCVGADGSCRLGLVGLWAG